MNSILFRTGQNRGEENRRAEKRMEEEERTGEAGSMMTTNWMCGQWGRHDSTLSIFELSQMTTFASDCTRMCCTASIVSESYNGTSVCKHDKK